MTSTKKRDVCTTLRPGSSCLFMRKETGCSFNNNQCQPIIAQCKGKQKNCDHVVVFQDNFCDAYMNPSYPWTHLGECPLATHLEKEEVKKKEIFDPRKAAKQRRRKG